EGFEEGLREGFEGRRDAGAGRGPVGGSGARGGPSALRPAERRVLLRGAGRDLRDGLVYDGGLGAFGRRGHPADLPRLRGGLPDGRAGAVAARGASGAGRAPRDPRRVHDAAGGLRLRANDRALAPVRPRGLRRVLRLDPRLVVAHGGGDRRRRPCSPALLPIPVSRSTGGLRAVVHEHGPHAAPVRRGRLLGGRLPEGVALLRARHAPGFVPRGPARGRGGGPRVLGIPVRNARLLGRAEPARGRDGARLVPLRAHKPGHDPALRPARQEGARGVRRRWRPRLHRTSGRRDLRGLHPLPVRPLGHRPRRDRPRHLLRQKPRAYRTRRLLPPARGRPPLPAARQDGAL
ncbi:MAG: hypothetical protein AVDCRST_MAG25-2394, partial [uncultured Rubrobacteraceae bacterium]